MSDILAQCATDVHEDASYDASGTWDRTPPDGIKITCLGLNRTGNNPGTVGMIFEVDTPTGYTLDNGASGSMRDPNDNGSGPFIRMVFSVLKEGETSGTQRWEVWFNESDVYGDNWSLPVEVTVSDASTNTSTTYTYNFRKGGSGGHRRR